VNRKQTQDDYFSIQSRYFQPDLSEYTNISQHTMVITGCDWLGTTWDDSAHPIKEVANPHKNEFQGQKETNYLPINILD
jgi:hypothetical protein